MKSCELLHSAFELFKAVITSCYSVTFVVGVYIGAYVHIFQKLISLFVCEFAGCVLIVKFGFCVKYRWNFDKVITKLYYYLYVS